MISQLIKILPILMITGIPWVFAETLDFNRLADSIYKAEGGAATRHPYGIMARYKHTTPRQACLNTIRHKFSDWQRNGSQGQFLTYLASKYCPMGGTLDDGTCKNWEPNVRAIYSKLAVQDKGMGNG